MKADIVIDPVTSEPSLTIFNNFKFPEIQLFLRRKTRGKVMAFKSFIIETCGTETIESYINRLEVAFTVSPRDHLYEGKNYKGMIYSTSRLCPITNVYFVNHNDSFVRMN